MLSIEQRVQSGIRLLNEVVPGWHHMIDVDILDLHETDECILGQVFGDYIEGIDALGITGYRRAQADCGFDLYADEYIGYTGDAGKFLDLTNAWVKAIQEIKGER